MRLLLDLRGDGLGRSLGEACGWPRVEHELRAFPDGESYIRIDSAVGGAEVALLAELSRPNQRTLEVLLVAATLRAQGAASVGLVAPYLPYMRQDRAFREGESVSSRHFAALLGERFDWLLTVDAHLHRFGSLAELYAVPALNISAAGLLADWVRANVARPLLVGPDAESTQWVAQAARSLGCPWIALDKVRRGDRNVSVHAAAEPAERDRTPVLLDDMISTGGTLAAAIGWLRETGFPPAQVLAVHGIFAGDAHAALLAAGAGRVVTTNSIPHPTNAIDLAQLLAAAMVRRADAVVSSARP